MWMALAVALNNAVRIYDGLKSDDAKVRKADSLLRYPFIPWLMSNLRFVSALNHSPFLSATVSFH